jgi:hypothetical protein
MACALADPIDRRPKGFPPDRRRSPRSCVLAPDSSSTYRWDRLSRHIGDQCRRPRNTVEGDAKNQNINVSRHVYRRDRASLRPARWLRSCPGRGSWSPLRNARRRSRFVRTAALGYLREPLELLTHRRCLGRRHCRERTKKAAEAAQRVSKLRVGSTRCTELPPYWPSAAGKLRAPVNPRKG